MKVTSVDGWGLAGDVPSDDLPDPLNHGPSFFLLRDKAREARSRIPEPVRSVVKVRPVRIIVLWGHAGKKTKKERRHAT